MKLAINEKDHAGLIETWKEEAKKLKTTEELTVFIDILINDYQHDYGTICHAIAAAAIAGAYVVERSPSGGITGFQAGAIFWEFAKAWGTIKKDEPCALIKYDKLLYPQYEDTFNKIPEDTWKWVQQEAKNNIAEVVEKKLEGLPSHVSSSVMAHWRSIVDGKVPFGLTIGTD